MAFGTDGSPRARIEVIMRVEAPFMAPEQARAVVSAATGNDHGTFTVLRLGEDPGGIAFASYGRHSGFSGGTGRPKPPCRSTSLGPRQ